MSKEKYIGEAALKDKPGKKLTFIIKDGSVTTNKIADENVTTDKVANEAVTTPKIAELAITDSKLGDSSIIERTISEGAVTTPKIANEAVVTDKIANENVTNEKLAGDSVTTSKIKDESVTTEKLAESSVETSKIKNEAITNDKMAHDSVGTEQVINESIVNSKLSKNAVSTEKLQDGSVTNEKMAKDSLTQDKLDPELRKAIQAATGLPEDLVETIQNVDDTLKDHQNQLNDKQSQIDDKQQQITANDEDISLLQTRSTQMEETIKGIAATGGASQATAVTYNNANSQLAAINIQSAVDELQGSKIDKTSISQVSGDAEDKVMSQKAASTQFGNLISNNTKTNALLCRIEVTQGNLNSDGTPTTTDTDRIKSDFIETNSIEASIISGFNYKVFYYDKNKLFLSCTDWLENTETSVNCNTNASYIRIVFRKTDNSKVTVDEFFEKSVFNNDYILEKSFKDEILENNKNISILEDAQAKEMSSISFLKSRTNILQDVYFEKTSKGTADYIVYADGSIGLHWFGDLVANGTFGFAYGMAKAASELGVNIESDGYIKLINSQGISYNIKTKNLQLCTIGNISEEEYVIFMNKNGMPYNMCKGIQGALEYARYSNELKEQTYRLEIEKETGILCHSGNYNKDTVLFTKDKVNIGDKISIKTIQIDAVSAIRFFSENGSILSTYGYDHGEVGKKWESITTIPEDFSYCSVVWGSLSVLEICNITINNKYLKQKVDSKLDNEFPIKNINFEQINGNFSGLIPVENYTHIIYDLKKVNDYEMFGFFEKNVSDATDLSNADMVMQNPGKDAAKGEIEIPKRYKYVGFRIADKEYPNKFCLVRKSSKLDNAKKCITNAITVSNGFYKCCEPNVLVDNKTGIVYSTTIFDKDIKNGIDPDFYLGMIKFPVGQPHNSVFKEICELRNATIGSTKCFFRDHLAYWYNENIRIVTFGYRIIEEQKVWGMFYFDISKDLEVISDVTPITWSDGNVINYASYKALLSSNGLTTYSAYGDDYTNSNTWLNPTSTHPQEYKGSLYFALNGVDECPMICKTSDNFQTIELVKAFQAKASFDGALVIIDDTFYYVVRCEASIKYSYSKDGGNSWSDMTIIDWSTTSKPRGLNYGGKPLFLIPINRSNTIGKDLPFDDIDGILTTARAGVMFIRGDSNIAINNWAVEQELYSKYGQNCGDMFVIGKDLYYLYTIDSVHVDSINNAKQYIKFTRVGDFDNKNVFGDY